MFKKFPIPNKDAQWIAYCSCCDEWELFVSRGGYNNGGIEHCYTCGNEKETRRMKEEDIKDMILSSWSHWQKFPKYPYDWHALTEDEKWKILGLNQS